MKQTGQTYTPPEVNKLKLSVAQTRAGTQGLGFDKILGDVVLLLDEVRRVRDGGELDRHLVAHLEAKYGPRTP